MTRSRLRNRLLKNRSEENRKLFRKQKNKCVSVLRKSKKDYFANLKEKNIADNKRFWETVKPFLSKKNHLSESINLTEEANNSLLTNSEEVAKELNNLFANAVKNLNISNYKNCNSLAENIDNPNLKVIAKWRNHPSTLVIASEYKNRANFPFNSVSKEDVLTEIKMLDVSKAIQECDIPVKTIEANENLFTEAICFYFNKSLENGKFPNCLKLANITSVFKKGARTSKNNYRPVSILAVFSKIFERLLSRQLLEFVGNILSKFQRSSRNGYGTQHCLLLMLGIWKEATENN